MKDRDVVAVKGIISAPRQTVTVGEMNETILVRATRNTLLAEGEWLAAEMVGALQQPPPPDTSQPTSDWKRCGLIFGVPLDGKEYFARYQFDAMYQPRPIIEAILTKLDSWADPWRIAAWFHFPNGWISDGSSPVAPKDTLDRSDDVLEAARKTRGSFAA